MGHLTITTIRPSAATLKRLGSDRFYERLIDRLQQVPLAAGFLGVYNIATLLRQQGLLFEVRRFEPGLYASVTLAFLVVAVAAAWIPARRAAVIQPMAALRGD